MAQVAKLARSFPSSLLAQDPSTKQLKLVILQGQLLGRELQQQEQLAPEMIQLLRRCPMVRPAARGLRAGRRCMLVRLHASFLGLSARTPCTDCQPPG